MKVRDFKVIATLPEEYEYRLFEQDDGILVIGAQHQSVIAFRVKDGELLPLDLSVIPYPTDKGCIGALKEPA
jgi:hypothetical protein